MGEMGQRRARCAVLAAGLQRQRGAERLVLEYAEKRNRQARYPEAFSAVTQPPANRG